MDFRRAKEKYSATKIQKAFRKEIGRRKNILKTVADEINYLPKSQYNPSFPGGKYFRETAELPRWNQTSFGKSSKLRSVKMDII